MKRFLALVMTSAIMLTSLAGCQTNQQGTSTPEGTTTPVATTDAAQTTAEEAKSNPTGEPVNTQTTKAPKYIFMFIGDGMSAVQVNSAQVMNGNNTYGEIATDNLAFTNFPVLGMATTQDSTSFAPDSASTATSLASGYKTHSGVIGLAADKTTEVTLISELLKEQGMKIGIVSTVTINHATPAAYYAHVESRNSYYDIALQMAESGFDYFGGGSISQATGKEKDQKDAYEIMKENGYSVVNTKAEIEALDENSGKVYAVTPRTQDSGAMPYAIDQTADDLSFADFVKKGIDVMYNENEGFFLMGEGGKIDWSCHANDAKTTIDEVLDFEAGVQVAIDFANEHPDETLIIVTGDHETGGMTIGYASTGYDTAFQILDAQKMSYVEFDNLFNTKLEENPNLTFEEIMPIITENFGLKAPTGDAAKDAEDIMVMNDYEYEKLQEGFAQAVTPADAQEETFETDLLYGGYNALSISLTHLINNKAGIGWTSYSHTGVPVPVYVQGVGAEEFGGFYDNTDVFHSLAKVTGVAS